MPSLAFQPVIRSLRVERGPAQQVLDYDAVWGAFEDKFNEDPSAEYRVVMVDANGHDLGYIENSDIERYPKPASVCKVTFDLSAPDCSRMSGTKIGITSPKDQMFSRTLLTNTKGHAEIYLQHKARVLIALESLRNSLDCIIPSTAEVTFDELVGQGSWLPTEQRGMIV